MNNYINDILGCKIFQFTSTSTQSTNSKRKHLKQIFNLILEENLKYRNEYGYSEIPVQRFKKIDKRHYKELLYWLEENSLIKIRKSKFGKESYSGEIHFYKEENGVFISTDEVKQKPFCKGYKIDEILAECSGIFLNDIDPFISVYRSVLDIISNPSHSIIKGGYSSFNTEYTNTASHSIIKGGYSSLETVTTYPQWNISTSWNQLVVENNPDLPSDEYKRYENNLKKSYSLKDGRYFGQFHFMNKDHIQYLRLFGEHIQEWGDGTAFFTKLIGKLIEDVEDIPYQEKYNFQQLAINDPYIHLMKKLHLSTREDAKDLLNIYINSINQSATKMRNIDEYFQTKFPHIRTWLRSIPTVKEKDKETGKMKIKKQMWKLNQNMELEIMTKLAAQLNKEYGVFPLTKHDAIYLNTSDIKTLNKNNVSFQSKLKKILNYQYYNDTLFEL